MKLCIDCKHFKLDLGARAPYPHQCWVAVSLVTGEPYPMEAEKLRANDQMCGIEAKSFEPLDSRESLL